MGVFLAMLLLGLTDEVLSVGAGSHRRPIILQSEQFGWVSIIIDTKHSLRGNAQLGNTVEGLYLTQQQNSHHFSSKSLHQLDSCIEGAAGCQNVIDEHHFVSSRKQVTLHFDHVTAVFQPVSKLLAGSWELALLADRVAGPAHSEGERRAEEEALRLQHEQFVVLQVVQALFEGVNDQREHCWLAYDGENVDKGDSWLGEISIVLGGCFDLQRPRFFHLPDISFIAQKSIAITV